MFSAERDGLGLIGAVLNCPTWFDTAKLMLDWGFENFRAENTLESGARVATVAVRGGAYPAVAVVAEGPLQTAVPVGSSIKTDYSLPESLEAPVYAGQALGRARLIANGVTVAECDLVAADSVARLDFAQSLKRLLRRWVLRLQRRE